MADAGGGYAAIANMLLSIPELIKDTSDKNNAAKALSYLKDPYYEQKIPDGLMEAVNRTKNMGSSFQMPGQSNLETAQDSILSENVDSINRLSSSSSEGLQAILGAYKNRFRAQNDIGFRSANNYMDRQRDITHEDEILGEYQKQERDKAFEINVQQPFLRKYNNIMGTLGGYQQAIGNDNANIRGGAVGTTAVLTDGYDKKSSGGGGAGYGSMIPAEGMDNYNYDSGNNDWVEQDMPNYG